MVDEQPRVRLNHERVLAEAVRLADEIGVDALSMRRLAGELGVVPMALYKHVRNKEELLDGMVGMLIAEIPVPDAHADWKARVRAHILSARSAFRRHPWARRVVESRISRTPEVFDYTEVIAGHFLAGGLGADLTHHAMHALGGRMWGFTQELFDESDAPRPELTPEQQAAMMAHAAARYPNVVAVAMGAAHDESVVGRGCDDDFEFAFALDLLLDGFERLRAAGWTSRH